MSSDSVVSHVVSLYSLGLENTAWELASERNFYLDRRQGRPDLLVN